jgi:hypothetical protein
MDLGTSRRFRVADREHDLDLIGRHSRKRRRKIKSQETPTQIPIAPNIIEFGKEQITQVVVIGMREVYAGDPIRIEAHGAPVRVLDQKREILGFGRVSLDLVSGANGEVAAAVAKEQRRSGGVDLKYLVVPMEQCGGTVSLQGRNTRLERHMEVVDRNR